MKINSINSFGGSCFLVSTTRPDAAPFGTSLIAVDTSTAGALVRVSLPQLTSTSQLGCFILVSDISNAASTYNIDIYNYIGNGPIKSISSDGASVLFAAYDLSDGGKWSALS